MYVQINHWLVVTPSVLFTWSRLSIQFLEGYSIKEHPPGNRINRNRKYINIRVVVTTMKNKFNSVVPPSVNQSSFSLQIE